MTKKQVYIVAAFTLVVLAGVFIGLFSKGGPGLVITGNPISSSTSNEAGVPAKPEFTSNVPKDIQPTTPVKQVNADSTGKNQVDTFNVSISSAGFNPADIAVKKGDSVEVFITASGGDYDWSVPYVGYYAFVKKGETKKVAFDATMPGTFSIECRDHCPANGKIFGNLIIIP